MSFLLFIWFLIRFAVAAALTAGFMAVALALGFGAIMPEPPKSAAEKTDAIVVLTGGEKRLETGFELLKQGMAPRLYVSGADPTVTRAQLLQRLGDPPADLAQKIELDYRARNTRENARETAAWFNAQGMKSLRLVTGNYHMRRSVLLFERALPSATIVMHPVVPTNLGSWEWWASADGLETVAREFVKFGAAIVDVSLD